MPINNPYLYHPHPLCKSAAEEVCTAIASRPEWEREFGKGKMVGVLVVESRDAGLEAIPFLHPIDNKHSFLAAYSGIVEIEANNYFVPAVYDLNNPDDFYKEEERKISEINRRISELSVTIGSEDSGDAKKEELIKALKAERKQRSQALQLEIFRHFDFYNYKGEKKNIIDIFAEAKRGLPPGGAGECAAPRLLQYAFSHGLAPVAIEEFWYGNTPSSSVGKTTGNLRQEIRVHRQFYPSCIEKCSPILKYMLGESNPSAPLLSNEIPQVIYEDEHIIIINKPAEVLSAPAKDTTLFNVEDWLHDTHPDVRGPMLVHRLDQSTSGLMIAAKNATVFKTIQQYFTPPPSLPSPLAARPLKKTYYALIEGDLPSECGVINLPICPNPDDRPRQVVDRQFGKTAISRYKVLSRKSVMTKEGKEATRTLLELTPFTGRTHQLRLHCASPFGLNHPIVGDRIYTIETNTLAECPLHLRATALSFQHPVTQQPIKIKLEDEDLF